MILIYQWRLSYGPLLPVSPSLLSSNRVFAPVTYATVFPAQTGLCLKAYQARCQFASPSKLLSSKSRTKPRHIPLLPASTHLTLCSKQGETHKAALQATSLQNTRFLILQDFLAHKFTQIWNNLTRILDWATAMNPFKPSRHVLTDYANEASVNAYLIKHYTIG